MDNQPLLEVYRDGEPTHKLFLSEENARLWINVHGTDGATYSVRPFSPW